MSLPHSRIATAFVALAVIAALTQGCSGSDDAAPPQTPAAPAPPQQPASTDAPDEPDQAAAASPTAAPAPSTSPTTVPAPSTTSHVAPPHRAELPSGLFLLAEPIARRLNVNMRLSFVLVAAETGSDGSELTASAGFSRGATEASERHRARIDTRLAGPEVVDPAEQARHIDDLVVSGDVDCVAVEVPEVGAADAAVLARAIDKAVNAGVPVFTVGGDSPDSRRFAFYGLDDFVAGERTGSAVGRWAVNGRILLRKAGVLAGDADDPRSQRLMEGFIAGITAELPELEFVNGPDSVESLGFDPERVYALSGRWIAAHPDVDIIFHADSGLEAASRYIADESLYGDVSMAGFHMSTDVLRYIREGVVVAATVPALADQAAAAARACGDFLLAGAYHTGTVAVDPLVVTEDNLGERDWASLDNRVQVPPGVLE